MTKREEIQAEVESRLADARKGLEKLRAKIDGAERDSSEEVSEATEKAERLLARGRAKLDELANASDEKFDEIWAESKDGWDDLTREMDGHFDELTRKVGRFFS